MDINTVITQHENNSDESRTVSSSQRIRDRLNQDIENYIAHGGMITQIETEEFTLEKVKLYFNNQNQKENTKRGGRAAKYSREATRRAKAEIEKRTKATFQ